MIPFIGHSGDAKATGTAIGSAFASKWGKREICAMMELSESYIVAVVQASMHLSKLMARQPKRVHFSVRKLSSFLKWKSPRHVDIIAFLKGIHFLSIKV